MSEEFSYVEEHPTADDGRAPLALALGIAAALAAGGLWAALVLVTNMEIGYAAVGVGLLVGFAMSRATVQRTQQLAIAAAVFAVVGLAAGKAFTWIGSVAQVADEFQADEEIMRSAVAWQMYAERTLDDETLAAVDRTESGADTLSDAAWASMLQQADDRLATMTDAEKQEVAKATADGILQTMGVVGGIKAQLSMFDMLWALLAIGSAYRMLASQKEEVGAAEVADESAI